MLQHGFEMDAYAFAKISCVFVVGGVEYLLRKLEVLKTQEFTKKIHGYIVSPTDTFKLCRVTDLLDCHPVGLYSYHDNDTDHLVVILKYTIPFPN